MRAVSLALFFCGLATAQPLTFYIDNSNGSSPSSQLQQLPASFAFPNTPFGASSKIVVRVVNSSNATTTLNTVFIGAAPNSSTSTPDFTITGLDQGAILAPQAWKLFTINFNPSAESTAVGYLQGEANNTLFSVSTLTGTGTAPQLTLSCTNVSAPGSLTQCNGGVLQPNSTTALDFGNVLTTASTAVQFTLTNNGTVALDPQTLVSLPTATNNPNSPFVLSALPATLAGGSATTFTISFAPGSTGLYKISLVIGDQSFPLQGTGVSSVTGDISSLLITYTDATGIRLTAQPATAINFGQAISGATGNVGLTFVVANPATTIGAVTVPTLAVTGAAFTLSGVPPLPAVIQPGQSITFSIAFNATAVGSYTGTLSIGTRQFSLTGQTVAGIVSSATISVDMQPLTSDQQAHVSVTLQSPTTANLIGMLTLKFTPSVTNVSDDPAVTFVATSGRQLQVTVPAGSATAAYNGQSAITFQTGTTAGTITFTATFPNSAPFSKSFTLAPQNVQILTSSAQRQAPNLVVTLTGYDNTYSTGPLAFTFYDTSGKVLAQNMQGDVTCNGSAVDITTCFHQFFFTNNTTGGVFSIQATFPVNGDVTQVGSVSVNASNSAGQASVSQNFQ